MILFKKITDLKHHNTSLKNEGKRIGFVPTMGALHRGHLTLIEQAKAECDQVVVSIFVNPEQFNNKEDLKKYPITIESDIEKLYDVGTDILFLPDVVEMYPPDFSKKLELDLGHTLNATLEAAARPGHFTGVALVVKRLLDIVEPDALYMGQKDFQQFLVVKRLIEFYEMPVDLVRCDIVREDDGLAMSSRNVHLSPEGRQVALGLSDRLYYCRDQANGTPLTQLKAECIEVLNADEMTTVAYFDFVNANTLEPVNSLEDAEHVALVAAALIDGVHLLDNVIIS